jgi:hypothetical protein
MAAERIEPTLDLSAVLVEVTWVADSLELAEIRKHYESRVQRSQAGPRLGPYRRDDGVKSFSVLGKRNGEWVCLVFAERPQVVNDSRTTYLGHELAHCLLGEYHGTSQ